MNPNQLSNAMRNGNVFRFLSYTLVFLLLLCAVLTVGAFFSNVVPGWHAGVMASTMLFIVIDRLYTYRQLRLLTPLSSEWAVAVGAQWVLIVLLIRFLLSYANGIDSLRADLALFARGEISELFTLEFVVSLLLALLMWSVTGRFLDVLDEIGLDQKMALEEGPPPTQSDAVPAHQKLVGLIFSLGIGLVILTALARVNLQEVASNTEGLPAIEFSGLSGAEAGALLYFVFGLALLSLSRLMSLQTHWNRLRIPISSQNLTRQWAMYSLFFLIILGLIVSLLPAGDSLGLFSVLGTLFEFLLSILFFLGQLLLSLIVLLVSLPFFLLGQGPPIPNSPPPPPPLPNLPVQPAEPLADNAAWIFARSILLWGLLAAILIFVIVQFVRQHGGILPALRNSRVGNWLALAWQWLSRNADQTRGSLSRAIADGWQTIISRLEGRRVLPLAGLVNLRSLDPRRQIYFFYLAMIRRGGEQGVPRKPSQSPTEYAAALERALPEAVEDIDSITGSFVEARYSRHEVNPQDANVVKATWGRIRRALQSKAEREKSKKN
jgi:hypothetical protein